jgi:hypothetical protein
MPNAAPHPVAIAFITVAEPGDCTLNVNLSSSLEEGMALNLL